MFVGFFVLFLFLVKTPIVSIANKCTCRLLFLPLRVTITVMMMMMMMMMTMMSFSLALGSIDLNAQCAEGYF